MGNWCCRPAIVTASLQPQENELIQHADGTYIPNTESLHHNTDLQDQNKDDLKSSGYSTSHESSYPLSDYSYNFRDSRNQYEESEENTHLSQEHQRIIKRNFRYLKDELDPEFLLDYFIQEELFTGDQADEVKSVGCRRKQVDLFLRFLLRSRKNSYSQFLDTLDQIKCGHIRKRLETKDEGIPVDPPGSTNRDIESTRQRLHKYREKICFSIDDPSRVAEYFIQYEEFTIDEYELVTNQSTRKQKAEQLLDTLLKNSHLHRGYDILNFALREEDGIILSELDRDQKRKEGRRPANAGHFSEFQSVDDGERCFTPRVKGATAMCLTIECNNETSKKREEAMVKKAKKYKVRLDLNNDLVSDTECLITKVDQGSIVLVIKGCKKGAIERLLESPDGAGVSKILQTVFSHPKIAKIFYPSESFHVTIDILPPPAEEIIEKTKTPKQIICTNLNFLTEELDALRFLYLDIFTEEEKADILRSRPKSRSECTELMLRYICKKNDNDIQTFLDEIKQKKRFVWDQLCSSESKECFDDQILSTFYKDIVENLSPFKIAHYCVERKIVDKSVVKKNCFKRRQREECAKMLILDILSKDCDTRNVFLHILKAFDQISPALFSKADQVCANENVKLPGQKFQGTYCLTASGPMEPRKADQDHSNKVEELPGLKLPSKYCTPAFKQTEPLNAVRNNDDDKRDDESGYHSLNSNRRSLALSELESLQESNEKQTLQFVNIPEGETLASDHGAKDHFIKDHPHLKRHLALISRPMTVPRCLPVVHFDQGVYDITTRPRHTRSVLPKDNEDVTEVCVQPSGEKNFALNSNTHSGCSRHSLQISLSQNMTI